MSPLTIRRVIRRARNHTSTVFAVAVLAAAVAGHHSGIAMGDQHHGEGLPASVELCLGVFFAVGAAAVAVAFAGFLRKDLRPCRAWFPSTTWHGKRPPEPRARAGPSAVSMLCVSRC